MGHGDGAEEEGLHEGPGQPGRRGHEAGEERGEGDHPWAVHGEDARQAREDHREGLLRGRPEEERLSLSLPLDALSLSWLAVPSGSPAGAAPVVGEAMCKSCWEWVYMVAVEMS